jgi:guanylate kinase
MHKSICFITGASGVGKTTLLDELARTYPDAAQAYFHFDSIDVPSLEAMAQEYGTIEGWQKAKTQQWIDRLVHQEAQDKIVIEGQVNLNFIREAFAQCDFSNYQIILIDCQEDEMVRRLLEERQQPELVNPDMLNWLRYLRKQALDLEAPIIDTGELPIASCVKRLRDLLLRLIPR